MAGSYPRPGATTPPRIPESVGAARHPRRMDSGLDVSTTVSLLLVLAVGLALGAVTGALWSRARTPAGGPVRRELEQAENRAAEAAVVRERLGRVHPQAAGTAHARGLRS